MKTTNRHRITPTWVMPIAWSQGSERISAIAMNRENGSRGMVKSGPPTILAS